MLDELRDSLRKSAAMGIGTGAVGPMNIAAGNPLGADFKALMKYWGSSKSPGYFGAGVKSFAGAHPVATAIGGMVGLPLIMRMLRQVTGGGYGY